MRYLILSGVCVLVVALIALRLPRLNPDGVLVTRADTRPNEMIVEYRMPRPFEVGLFHGIRKPNVSCEGPGIHVGSSSSLREEPGEFISSDYDWIRGEHCVRLAFRRGPVLSVEANGRSLQFAAWSPHDTQEVRWHPPGERVTLGDGIGKDIVTIAKSVEQHEYLMLYAGTDIRNRVR